MPLPIKKYLKPAFFLIAVLELFYFCGKDTPLPTAKISKIINGNLVEFTLEATDAEYFEWDFGDGTSTSSEQNPVHLFIEFGKEYIVTLKIKGPGGITTVTDTVAIRPMNSMEILTGGENDTDGRRWRLSKNTNTYLANADINLTVEQSLKPGFLNDLGFTDAYLDEFVFLHNGDYRIIPHGNGILGGLTFCRAKNILNAPPSQEAAAMGLTLIDPFTPQSGLKFAFNESKNLTVKVSDEHSSGDIIIPDVMTLSFSKGGFLGLNNWVTECVITDLKETSMKVAFFTSSMPAESPLAGRTNGVLIFTFEQVE